MRDQMVSKLVYTMLWVVFLLRGWCWCPGDACLDEEKTALLRLKPLFDSYIDGVNNWGEKGLDCCEWEKVECDNSTGRVIRLYLNLTTTEITPGGYEYTDPHYLDERGQWYLNVSLFLPFEQLHSLYLSGNSIVGFLDHQGFEEQSRKLGKLEILDLSGNYFNDSILPFLSELSSLKSLNLAGNKFDGSNPNDGIKRLSKLKNLERLYLSGNSFENDIVSNLRNLTSLRSLSLQECGLQGTLQMQDFDNFMNLKELYLSSNEIESLGSSFQELGLKVLDLSYNRFNNTIFSSLSSLSSLKSLYISGNKLEGAIHIKEINSLSSLEELYMEYNQVNDFVPSQDNETLMNLKSLHLRGNLFNHSILTFLGDFSNLKSLSLGVSKFQGLIDLTELYALTHLEELSLYCGDDSFVTISSTESADVKYCSLPLQSLTLWPDLRRLRLDGITFQGTIMTPQKKRHNFPYLEELIVQDSSFENNSIGNIGQFTSLKRLELSSCEINGSLTLHGICELGNLKELGLSMNGLEGSLPECFSGLTSLQSLYLSGNRLSGNISVLGSLTSLQTLDLSSNHFSGNIFPLENLTSLETLQLSDNHFSGNISAIEGLTSLQSLDLSSNQFSGNINDLKNLASLQELWLSNNNFQIPISLRPLFNLSKLQYINADNNTICAETQIQDPNSTPTFQLKRIRLSCCGDVGSFPEFLYHQHHLWELDLSNLFFEGNQFPNWLLINNTELLGLDLTNTSLSGPLQLQLASQTRLTYFYISNNFFNGSIPVELGEQLPSLRYLNMSNNHFIGSIPSSLGNMTSLDTLDLSNNRLSGGMPEHLTMSCPSLAVLALSNNKLEGNVFSGNFNLTGLRELRLDGNNFSGKIPKVLSKSPLLSTLDVSNNHLSGGIPRWMGNMSSLDTIIMSNNHLQGTIPVEFCRLNLILLDLSVNNISGSIPPCVSSFLLTQLHLSKNRLQGTLPDRLRNSFALVTLDVSHNYFTGSIPRWIGELSTLSYLLLSNNFFQGEIPMELCNLNQLSLINLSHNNLSGRIPPCLKITTFEDAPEDYAYGFPGTRVNFSLNEPIDFPIKNVSNSYTGEIISLVSGIDLSCNKLVGEIPYQIGNFHKIIVLNLSHNSLTGLIPLTFSNLKQIESLDLSYNKLSGSIPPQLVGLNFLAYFIVSFNNLSGKTPPRSAQFATFDEISYRGNPFLCGEPLPKCEDIGPSSPMPNSSTGGEEDHGLIDMEVFRVSFIVSYMVLLLTVAVVLYINPYWRKAWFYHAETAATCCYYFVLDNILPRRYHC